MCGPRPRREEKQAAAEQRVEADVAKREEIEKRAEQKREDISQALEARTERRGMRGGAGRAPSQLLQKLHNLRSSPLCQLELLR